MKRILFICTLLLAMVSFNANAQKAESFTLNGTVVDANNEPIIGAMVYVKD